MQQTYSSTLKLDVAPRRELLPQPPAFTNFGEVVPGQLYRGEHPDPTALEWLAANGFKTVVVLREDREQKNYRQDDYRDAVERLGMRFIVIPIPDGAIPRREQIRQFIRIVDEPSQSPVFVHCAAGIGRTSVMCGLYLKWKGTPVRSILDRCRLFGLVPERRSDLSLQATFIATYPLGLL